MITDHATRRPAPAPASGPARPARGRLAWAAGTAVVAAALFACYLRQSRTISVGSDGASQALQAWDMLHGNPLLHGWWLTDVSFYSTELPQYAGLELIRGLSPDVIHVAGAMTYTLLVLAAAFLARGRATGPGGLARALIAGGIMLAPQLGPGTQTLVLSPDHTGTAVPLLLIWLLIDRRWSPGGTRWYVPVLAGLGLAVTALADAMALFVAVIPLALVCALLIARGVIGRREPLRDHRPALALLAAAVLAFPAELAATALIRAHGGWQVNGLSPALAGAGRLAGNARLTGKGLLELFGADVFGAASSGSGSGLAVAFAAVHLVGAALAAAAVIGAARRLFAGTGREALIPNLLVTGIVIDLAAYLAGVQAVNASSAREIAPVLPFAAVLAGRRFAPRLLTPRPLGERVRPGRVWPGRVRPGAVLAGVLALSAGMLGYAAAQPPAAPQYADLAAWLPAHHLTAGLSGYHQANIVTLESGGAVTLRPVTAAGRRVTAYTWNASAEWFDPAQRTATFLVLAGPGITIAQATATFGRPARTYRYRDYAIMVWPRGDNLLDRLP